MLLCVIRRGANTGMCQREELCKHMNFHINGSNAIVEIPHTSVGDSGNYSIELVFSGWKDSYYKEVQWLNVIEGIYTYKHVIIHCLSRLVPNRYLCDFGAGGRGRGV